MTPEMVSRKANSSSKKDLQKAARPPVKRAAFALAAILCGFVVAFAIAEGVLRVRHHFRPKPDEAFLFRNSSNRLRRFELRPGLKVKSHGGVPVNTNSFGFRGREYPLGKEPGVRRILLLGDSITFGLYQPEENIYSHFLEQLLNEKEGDFRYEVLNSAVGGYNVWNELGTLQEMGPILQPDLVILQSCMNDFAPSNYVSALGGVGVFNSRGDNLPEHTVFRAIGEFLEVHSVLVAGLLLHYDTLLRKKGIRKDYYHYYKPFYNQIFTGKIEVRKLEAAWREVLRATVEIFHTASRLGAGFLLTVYHPAYLMSAKEPPSGYSFQFEELAGRNGFPCIVMRDELLKRRGNNRLFRDRVHLNTFGHLLSAQILHDYLAEHPELF